MDCYIYIYFAGDEGVKHLNFGCVLAFRGLFFFNDLSA